MNGKEILKWALIAGAAYLIYSYLEQSGVVPPIFGAAAVPPTGGGATVIPPTGTPASTVAPGAPIVSDSLLAQIIAAAKADPQFKTDSNGNPIGNGWQWDYYYNKITGFAPFTGPSGKFQQVAPYSATNLMTGAQWAAQANASAGLTGLGKVVNIASGAYPYRGWRY